MDVIENSRPLVPSPLTIWKLNLVIESVGSKPKSTGSLPLMLADALTVPAATLTSKLSVYSVLFEKAPVLIIIPLAMN